MNMALLVSSQWSEEPKNVQIEPIMKILNNNNFNNNIPALILISQIIKFHALIMDPKTALKLLQAINLSP